MMKKPEKTQAVKPAKQELKPKPSATAANPSQKLSLLLRKESVLASKARKAKQELAAVQGEIKAAWTERERLNSDLMSDTGEV